MCRFLHEHICSVLLVLYLGVELPGHVVTLCLIFEGTAGLFSQHRGASLSLSWHLPRSACPTAIGCASKSPSNVEPLRTQTAPNIDLFRTSSSGPCTYWQLNKWSKYVGRSVMSKASRSLVAPSIVQSQLCQVIDILSI